MTIEQLKIIEWNEARPYEKDGRTSGDQITWTSDGQNYSLEVADAAKHTLGTRLSPDKQYLVLVFGSLKNFDTRDNNAAVFNSNASLRFFVRPPELISEKYKEYEKRVGHSEAVNSLRIIQPSVYNVNGKDIMTIWVGFDYDWYEIREFDPKTGEFGKCLGTGRM